MKSLLLLLVAGAMACAPALQTEHVLTGRARDVYGGVGTFGIVEGLAGAGAVCGALAFRRLHRWRGYRLALLGLPGFGLTVLVPGVLAGWILTT